MRMQIQSRLPHYHVKASGMGWTSPGLRGLGQQTIEQESATYGATAAQVGGLIGMAVGGPVLGAIVSTAINLATTLAVAIEKLFSGCGQTCVQATSIANQVAALLTQNVQGYVNNPVRTTSMQTAALATFDSAWAQLQQACGNPALGQAGQNCISQRQAGGCQWKTSPGGWTQNADGTCTYTWAGAAGSGTACWNWFNGMRDPIANDPCVISDAQAQANANAVDAAGGTSVVGAGGATTTLTPTASNLLPLVLIGGVAFLIFTEMR